MFWQQNLLFRQLSCFLAKWGLFFVKWGLLFSSIYVGKSQAVHLNLGDPTAPLHHYHFFSAKFKIAVALSAAGDRYLPQCAAEVHCPHQHLFKLMKGGAATAGTGGRHVSHWIEIIESLSLTLSWLDLAETTNTSLELGSEAYCTICSASTLIEGQNRCSKDDRQCW